MTLIIGLLGGAGSGKSTAASYLEQRYGAKRYSFAAPLKEFAKRVFDFTDDQIYGTQEQKETIDPRYNVTPRWMLQRLGTEGFRGVFGEQFWVDYLLKQVARDQPFTAVVEDVRFLNEANGIQGRGYVIRLENELLVSSADKGHQSEAEWARCPYDFYIKHDGKTLKYLQNQLDVACEKWGLRPNSML